MDQPKVRSEKKREPGDFPAVSFTLSNVSSKPTFFSLLGLFFMFLILAFFVVWFEYFDCLVAADSL